MWKSKPSYHSEVEMMDYFRQMNVRPVLDLGFTRYLGIEELREVNSYALETATAHRDTVAGLWITLDPRLGAAGLDEFKRCQDGFDGFVGFVAATAPLGLTPDDPVFEPFFDHCTDTNTPVLITVGLTGLGAGTPGGGGILLQNGHPMLIDVLAARRPELTILAGRPAWPWQTEMLAVLLHKANVWYELHGWSPKYYSDELKREISRRLSRRIMFGGDYPLFTYERLRKDWGDLGYEDSVYENVFNGNARRFLGLED